MRKSDAERTSGIVQRQRPNAEKPAGNPGLGAARHQLKAARGDSIPKQQRRGSSGGKRGC